LKQPPGAAGTEVVAAELFNQLDVAMNLAIAALDAGFRWEGFAALRGYLKSTAGR
jgi:hypothetical protein